MRQYEHATIDLKANQYIEEDVTFFHLKRHSIPTTPRPSTFFSYRSSHIFLQEYILKNILIPSRPNCYYHVHSS